MDGLIYSNPLPSKLSLNNPTRPFLTRVDPVKLVPPRLDSRRVPPLRCKLEESSGGYGTSDSVAAISAGRGPSLSSCTLDSPDKTLLRKSLFLKPFSAQESSCLSDLPDKTLLRRSLFLERFAAREQKGVSAGILIVLAVLLVILIQPIFASPAFASFQAAAKMGRPIFRSELLSSAWTGFLAGCLHTLSGPDHLAALAPLSIGRTRLQSALVGALWGCGHDAGQVIFGLIFLLLKDRLHIEVIRTWGTRVVGLTLLVIGGMGIREASEVPTPCVALENGECVVENYENTLDGGSYESALEGGKKEKKKVGFATFATGIIHGLQPDALMMVLPALALPSRLSGAAFLCMFLVGTVVAMGSYTVFIGSCSEALKERVPRITEKLTWASSLIAIALGLGIIVSQSFGFSLY